MCVVVGVTGDRQGRTRASVRVCVEGGGGDRGHGRRCTEAVVVDPNREMLVGATPHLQPLTDELARA
jgi:hypothetical protein